MIIAERRYRILFLLWFAVWASNIISTFRQEKDYVLFAIQSDRETIYEINTAYDDNSQDYYAVLMACNKFVPAAAQITLVLPREPSVRFNYLQEKGRYILYPHNYGDNQFLKEYVLVYGVDNYPIPQNYEIIGKFSSNKYLMKKKG